MSGPSSAPSLRPTAAACLAEWQALVRANAEQVERLREWEDPPDFYAPVADTFRADPMRVDDDTLKSLLELSRPEDIWLDVGAGGGRYALALALRVDGVLAVEPSAGMRKVLGQVADEYGIQNVQVLIDRWPMAAGTPRADVALMAHVGYDIAEIGPFLDALEDAAARLCVALVMERQPGAGLAPLWEAVHGEPRAELPALRELVTLLLARGRLPEVRVVGQQAMAFASLEEARVACRRRLWIAEGSEKDQRLGAALPDVLAPLPDGRWHFRQPFSRVVRVHWAPPAWRDPTSV